MRWWTIHGIDEQTDLTVEFNTDRFRVIDVDHFVQRLPTSIPDDPFSEVEMQPDAEPGPIPRPGGGATECGPTDHHAGARHDAPFDRIDDAGVDAVALTEIVGVDDQPTTVVGCM